MDFAETTPAIGVIGLGVMGAPIATRLLNAGYPVTVHSRSRKPVDELARLGASTAGSPVEVAERVNVVITVLPDTPDVEAVVLGPRGVLRSLGPGGLHIDMSTVAPELSQRIAVAAEEAGVEAIDAPVSGGQQAARDGTLSIMCGGTEAAVKRAEPLLAHLGARLVHVGAAGAGQLTKACNQIMVALTLQAMAEALCLASKAGLDQAKVVDALRGGAARCWALEVRAPRVLERDFSPGFRIDLHHKDLNLALDAGRRLGVMLPTTAAVHEFFGALRTLGRGDFDHSALVTLIEDLSACTVGEPTAVARGTGG